MSLDLHAAAPPEPGAPRAARHTRRRAASMTRLDLKYSPYLYVLPFFVIFAVFGVYPIAYTVWIALTDRSPLNSTISFVGMDNFVELITEDPQFWNAVVNTFGMFLLSTVPQLLLALMLANALNRKLRAQTFFRMAIAMPIITSTAVVALIFSMIYAKDFGLVNWLLDSVGLDPIDWRANRFASWFAISTMVDWRWVGYNALIYLAAMQSISKDMYEAAALDGASRRRQFWSITVPQLRPTIIFTLIISTIGGLQLFTEPLLFTSGSGGLSGGSEGQFQTITMYLLDVMNQRFRWGYAGAVALVLFVLIALMSAINYLLARRISSDK
ncbi:sugar ABC transporter permease [Micromonospora aurantiaca]|uniref:Sugar ABC transporter permease n=1 Tax=Micromonospora aurantiaca (nom. illeg.) TaxID=47850 RepID=A0A1C6SVJ0_9ACTN|nr:MULTISPECIES: sugar ABC transporter permease [Micromonospora]ADL45218.1 binding-protein-dependent transport systems inner membrane component [Micromonospora aurantiaca ATCC 27029]ADU07451.1 binding-protein-dependent transport systems inner membrane component [Micromonospora sp. L5]AXH91345.1 sugar ABC transporter permease [Micromonospora aurantiaca]KAB1114135.1 sugar ABC transporter permease [Micromonospora aurantiaca]MBC9002115.1 sugar ABC transporter permease [Micromonospora aurantiaca]